MINTRISADRRPEAINSQISEDPAPGSLIVCALGIGLLIGILAPSAEQVGLKAALVLAGIVKYPPTSPMSQYFFNGWTIVNQLGALLLRSGFEQSQVNAFFALVPRSVIVAGYTMIIYGFTKRPWFSLAAATICCLAYFSNPFTELFSSPDYPLPGFYALWAHAIAIWTIGSVAARWDYWAGFSAMALIAVHPFIGVYIATILAIAYFTAYILLKYEVRDVLRGSACGGALAGISFIIFLIMRPPFSGHVDGIAYQAYMHLWDYHRNQPMKYIDALRIGLMAMVAGVALITFMRTYWPSRVSVVLASGAILISVAASMLIYFIFHLFPSVLPQLLIEAMPGRLINIHAYISLPVAIALIAIVVNNTRNSIYLRMPRSIENIACKVTQVLPTAKGSFISLADFTIDRRSVFLTILLIVVIALGPAQKLRSVFTAGRESGPVVAATPTETPAFWHLVQTLNSTGQVLTAPEAVEPTLNYGHLPVILDVTAFDFVPYLPYTAGPVAHIIELGYGIPFYNPPPEQRFNAALSDDVARIYWARLSQSDWSYISKNLGIAAVIAPRNWIVKLPVLATGARFTLYDTSFGRLR